MTSFDVASTIHQSLVFGVGDPGGIPGMGGIGGGLPNAMQQHIKIAPALNLPEAARVALARLLPVALTAAVREIVSPVVERSVTIACMTTRELVLKAGAYTRSLSGST
jgi:CCR4-NOT transcription complex subunit 1